MNTQHRMCFLQNMRYDQTEQPNERSKTTSMESRKRKEGRWKEERTLLQIISAIWKAKELKHPSIYLKTQNDSAKN